MPTPAEQEKALSLTWNRLAGVTTQTATPSAEAMDNVRSNIDRPLPWFHSRFQVLDDKNRIPGKRIALVGGGPSIPIR